MRGWGFVGILMALARPCAAQLAAGDVAVVAYDTAGDTFAWVALRPLPAQTRLFFTDSSVSNGWFRWTEHLNASQGVLRWSCAQALPPGTVVRWLGAAEARWSLGEAGGQAPSLGAAGDQVIVYEGAITNNPAGAAPWVGDAAAAVVLFGLNFANAGWDNVTGGEPASSYVPPGVSPGNWTAVHAGAAANGYYRGPREGSRKQFLRWIARPENWATSAGEPSGQSWPTSFMVREGTLLSVQ